MEIKGLCPVFDTSRAEFLAAKLLVISGFLLSVYYVTLLAGGDSRILLPGDITTLL